MIPTGRTVRSFKITLSRLAQVDFAAGTCQTREIMESVVWSCIQNFPQFCLSRSCLSASDLFMQSVAESRAYGFPCLNKSEMTRCLCYLCDVKGYVSITIFTWK